MAVKKRLARCTVPLGSGIVIFVFSLLIINVFTISAQENRAHDVTVSSLVEFDRFLAQQVRQIEELEAALSAAGTASETVSDEWLSKLENQIAALEAMLLHTFPPEAKPSNPGFLSGDHAIKATLRLKSKPQLAKPVSNDGPNLFGIFEYDVIEVSDGDSAKSGKILVAQGIRWGGQSTGAMNREIGAEVALDLVPLWWYPKLMKVERIGDDRDDAAIYTPRLR